MEKGDEELEVVVGPVFSHVELLEEFKRFFFVKTNVDEVASEGLVLEIWQLQEESEDGVFLEKEVLPHDVFDPAVLGLQVVDAVDVSTLRVWGKESGV